MLARDNVEMRKLYEQVEAQQLPIQKNAYMGEIVMVQLGDLMDQFGDVLLFYRTLFRSHEL